MSAYEKHVDRAADSLSTAVLVIVAGALVALLGWIVGVGFVAGLVTNGLYHAYRAFQEAS